MRSELRSVAAYRQGILYTEGSLYEEAAAAFRQAIDASSRVTAAYLALGDVEFRRGRADEAVQAYRQVMARYPYRYIGELYRQVGLFELRGGRIEDAVRDLQEAVALDPEDWLAYHLLGHAYLRLGDRGGARAAWKQALRLNPDFRAARDQLQRLEAPGP